VEPDATLRADIKRSLGPYEFLEAMDGRRGMEMAERGRPDLVILNWELPDTEGADVLRHLKGIRPSLPLIVTSTSRAMEWPISAFRAGARDCFPLPFDPDHLKNTVETILRIVRAGQEHRVHVPSTPPETSAIEDPELQEICTRSPLRIRRAMTYVWTYSEADLSVERVAREAALSPRQLRREFRRITGMSPRHYIMRVRIAKAKAMLKRGASVTEAAFAVGYDGLTGMERAFRKLEGCTPKEYRHLKCGMRNAE